MRVFVDTACTRNHELRTVDTELVHQYIGNVLGARLAQLLVEGLVARTHIGVTRHMELTLGISFHNVSNSLQICVLVLMDYVLTDLEIGVDLKRGINLFNGNRTVACSLEFAFQAAYSSTVAGNVALKNFDTVFVAAHIDRGLIYRTFEAFARAELKGQTCSYGEQLIQLRAFMDAVEIPVDEKTADAARKSIELMLEWSK